MKRREVQCEGYCPNRVIQLRRLGCSAPRSRDDRGDTLLEVLVALMIIGIASVAILGAYTMSIGGSGRQKTLSQLNVLLHNVAESVTYQVQLQPQALAASPPSHPLYAPCATVVGTITSPSVNIVNGALNYAGSTLITDDFAMPAQTSVTLSSIQ